jgi:hypothetical protein
LVRKIYVSSGNPVSEASEGYLEFVLKLLVQVGKSCGGQYLPSTQKKGFSVEVSFNCGMLFSLMS